MANTGLFGPHVLNINTIIEVVKGIGAGTYALGFLNLNGGISISYIGRSDQDLGRRLKKHVGERYTHFKYAFFPSSKLAYEKECQLWHDFGGANGSLDNKIHPDRGENKNWLCPDTSCHF